jgi:hypothetical protein
MDNTTAYTLMPEPNITYLVKTKDVIVPADPLSGSTVGLMMILSTFQYQSPTVNPSYSNALNQASKAAFVEVGGQEFQNKIKGYGTDKGRDFVHSIGADTELGVLLGAAKVVRDRQIDVRGPNISFVHTHLTVGQDHGSIGLGWEWK